MSPRRSPEWLMMRELLENRDEATLRRVRLAIGGTARHRRRQRSMRSSARIALIGLRGAGKSTLGQMLAEELGFSVRRAEPRDRAVCRLHDRPRSRPCTARMPTAATSAARSRKRSRSTPRRSSPPPAAWCPTPATFNLLLSHCTTVWLQADPEDHMQRVIAQGDMRPMAGSRRSDGGSEEHPGGRASLLFEGASSASTPARSRWTPTFALRCWIC